MQPTLDSIVGPAAPEEILVFGPEISPGLPALRSVIYSVLVHGLVITALMAIRIPVARPPTPAEEALSPTEIRIGKHVYYVSQISGSPPNTSQRASRPAPAARLARKAKTVAKLQTPAAPAPAPASAPARAQPRAFIPPEVREIPTARQTLIQPLSPPDLTPQPTPLPTFRVLSSQIPKLPKPFVAPGRPNPPRQVPVLSPPAPMELVHADPQPTNIRPRLPLPRTPPLIDTPVPNAPDLAPPTPLGDPVNVLSISDRQIPMTDRLVVPPGNVAQVSGEGAGAGSSADQTNPRANPTSSNNQSSLNGLGSSATAGSQAGASDSGAASGAPQGAASGAAAGNGTSTTASASLPGSSSASSSASSPGTGSASSGSGVPGLAGANPSGGVTITGGGGARTPRATPGPAVMTRSPTGNFDAMVVQSSPLNQYPESRGLLSGRPIYSVYISVGAAVDWTFYFCIPGERPDSAPNSSVVQLGPPAAPVKAPYPTKLIRPEIALPSWEKYVLVHGYVNEEGHFEGLRLVRSTQPGLDQSLLASLTGWQFRPATRDGAAVMVEFLLSIPAKGL